MKARKLFQIRMAVAATCVVALSTAAAEEFQVTETWVMEITPAVKVSETPVVVRAATEPDADAGSATQPASTIAVDPLEYARIYRSIPFNRAEFNVNPSYRHDTTMEILTGIPRHQTIVEHSTVPREPVMQQPYTVPYRYNNADNGLNYYFYFPYWNYRGLF